MKKSFYLLFVLLIFILSSCGETNKVSFEDSVYYPDNAISDERIVLKNTTYDNDNYATTIFGEILLNDKNSLTTIPEQELELIQVYGNIWFSKIEIDEDDSVILYFHRLGDKPLSDTKKIGISDEAGGSIIALTYEKYKNVNFIIVGSRIYLL